jgi:hypothetical protein
MERDSSSVCEQEPQKNILIAQLSGCRENDEHYDEH